MTRSAENTDEALVFMVSQSSNTSYRRVLWRFSVADAKRICSDPRSKGRRSALFWATDNIDDPTANRFVRDAGHQGSLLRELGVTVLDSFQMREQRGGGAAAVIAHRDQTVDPDVVEFARLGSIKQVSMRFAVPVRNWPTFQAIMDTLNRGNGFDPTRIAATFRPLFDDAANVEFGHEGSEVLYVTVPCTDQQRLGSTGGTSVRLSDEERQAYTHRVIGWARDMGADEISVQQHPYTQEPVWNTPGDNPYKVRIFNWTKVEADAEVPGDVGDRLAA